MSHAHLDDDYDDDDVENQAFRENENEKKSAEAELRAPLGGASVLMKKRRRSQNLRSQNLPQSLHRLRHR